MRRLIVRPGAIGDFVVSLPALEFLRVEYTEVWTTAVNAPLVRFADRVESLYQTGIDTVGLEGRSVPARLRDFDSIVSWYGTNREEFRDAVAGLPFVFHQALPGRECGLHAVDFYLRQVGAQDGATPRLPVQTAGVADPPFAVIHPFSGGRRKNWELSRFREVAARLGVPVRWLAGPEERLEEADRFEDLGTLSGWISGARLYIGNDSGISHLAAACSVPVVAVFGPTDARVWAPRGRAVQVVEAPGGRLADLPVEAVLDAARYLLR